MHVTTTGAQLVAPAAEVVPAAHGVQLTLPALAANVFAGHVVQAAALLVAENVPG